MKSLKELEKLIDETENGIYTFDYIMNLKGDIYYYQIQVSKDTTLNELSRFLLELETWRIRNLIKDYQIIIEKNKFGGVM
jgi:hypothetical protein